VEFCVGGLGRMVALVRLDIVQFLIYQILKSIKRNAFIGLIMCEKFYGFINHLNFHVTD